MEKMIDFVIARSRPLFFGSLAVILALAIGLTRFHADFSIPSWFEKDSPRIKKLTDYIHLFGDRGVHYVAIVFEADRNKIDLAAHGQLIDQLKKLEHVEGVEATINYRHITDEAGKLVMKPMAQKYPDNATFFAKLDELKTLRQYLVSPDLSTQVFYVRVSDHVDERNLSVRFMERIKEIVSKYGQPGITYHYLGPTVMTANSSIYAKQENAVVMPAMTTIAILLLLFFFRSALIVAFSFFVVIATLVASFGLYFWLGYPMNALTGIIPGTLFPVAIATTVHILLGYLDEERNRSDTRIALREALLHNVRPIFLTSITTSVGFFSISFVELLPLKQLGVVCSIGTLLSFIFSLTLLPYLILKFRTSESIRIEPRSTRRLSQNLAPNLWRRNTAVLSGFLIAAIFFGWSSMHVETNNDLLKVFPPKSEMLKSYDFVRAKLQGASRRFPITIDSGLPDGALNPEFLKRVDAYSQELEAMGDVKRVTSALDFIKQANQALHHNDPAQYRIPDTEAEVRRAVDAYESLLPPGENIHHRITADRRHLKLRNYWAVESSSESITKSESYVALARQKYRLNAEINGFFAIYTALNGIVVDHYVGSMYALIGFILLAVLLTFRSLSLAIITVIPSLFTTFAILAFMRWKGIDLNIATCIVASICLGITVDDSLHFISTWSHERAHKSAREATLIAAQKTGECINLTTLVLGFSFLSFALGESPQYQEFGILIALGLGVSLVNGLILLPSLLIGYSRALEFFGRERRSAPVSSN